MRLIVTTVVLYLVTQIHSAEKVSYKGYKVLQTTPRTEQQLAFLAELLDVVEADVWKPVSSVNRSVIVNVAPKIAESFHYRLTSHGHDVKINIEDVQWAIDQQMKAREKRSANFDYGNYHDFAQILKWIFTIVNEHPTIASRFVVGNKTSEGRPLFGVKISSKEGAKRPAFWIHGGIHAREWISPATVMYIVAQFLEQYESDPAIREVVDMFDWYFLPVTNPDGYSYSWTSDRFWRKTRSKNAGSSCVGTDPNRNWDVKWSEIRSSSNPCSETYCGTSAFSEPEVKGVADFILRQGNFKAFIDVHSFSQLWMSPWGYTTTKPADFNIQDKGSQLAVAALEAVHGTVYEHGNIAQTIYPCSGDSTDWAYAKAGVRFSYGVELRDQGEYGFLLPADQIVPTGQETLQALMALATYVHNN